MIERVTLIVGGQRWTARERITIQYGAKQAARQFAFTVTDAESSIEDAWNFLPGTEVSVMAGGDLIVAGIIDKMSPSYDATNHKVEISGRSKSKDTIDSSQEHQTGEFRNKTILDIANELNKQGVKFSTDQQLKKIPLFRVNPGETVFSALDRAARSQGLLLVGTADGGIKITKGGDKRVHTPLIEGVNILGASATFDESQQNSEVKVKGQKPYGGPSKDTLQIVESAKNSAVKRNRPKVLVAEGDTDKETAKKRAEWHRDRQASESITCSVKVLGWRDDGGRVWEANTLVHIMSPKLKLDREMLLTSVSLSQDQSGTFAQLSFSLPETMGGKAGSKAKAKAKAAKKGGKDPIQSTFDVPSIPEGM